MLNTRRYKLPCSIFLKCFVQKEGKNVHLVLALHLLYWKYFYYLPVTQELCRDHFVTGKMSQVSSSGIYFILSIRSNFISSQSRVSLPLEWPRKEWLKDWLRDCLKDCFVSPEQLWPWSVREPEAPQSSPQWLFQFWVISTTMNPLLCQETTNSFISHL